MLTSFAVGALQRGTAVKGLALAAIAAFAAAFAWLQIARTGFVDVDTYQVLDGTAAIDRCLAHGLSGTCDGVNQFPLIQYLPALAAKHLGASFNGGLRTLIAVNGVALCGLLALMWRLGRVLGTRWVGSALALGVLASPLLWYSHAGFGEGLAAFLVALYAYTLIRRSPAPLIGASFLFAGLTKETAVVFLLLIAVLVEATARTRGEAGLGRRAVVALAVAAIATVAINAGLNVFRYGTTTNEFYTQAGFGMPLHLIPEYVVALLVSPTGGIVFMWPLFVVMLGASVVWGRRRGERPPWRRPDLGVLALFAALLLSFAAWHGPFGGAQWGSRLATPWLPALAMLTAAFYASELDAALGTIARSSRAALAAVAAVVLIGVAHLSVTVDSSHFFHPYPGASGSRQEVAIAAYFPDAQCPEQPDTPGSAYYLHCLDHWTWHQGWAVLKAYRALDRRDAPWFALAYALALSALAALAGMRSYRPSSRE